MLQARPALTRARSAIDLIANARQRLQGIDLGAATVKLVAAGLVLGTAIALLTNPNGTRNTDTSAELMARIAPVGSVNIAQSSVASPVADAAAIVANRDS